MFILLYQFSRAASISVGVAVFRGELLVNDWRSSALKASTFACEKLRRGGVGVEMGLVDNVSMMGMWSLDVIGPCWICVL